MENLFRVDDIKVDMPSKVLSDNVAKIAVIGVGGGGCNMIDHMINEGSHKIDLIAANTDLQVLHNSKAPKKIQLGLKLTRGLGAGMKPEVGRDSAVESYEEIKATLKGSDIVFIAAGLGGGTGTGAAAIIAKAAKEVGALTVSVVTKPFSFEGKSRAGLANLGLSELKKVSDSIIVIQNDKLLEEDPNITLIDGFKMVDNILYQAVNGMSEVILSSGKSSINTDFADVQTIMQHKGIALMAIGRAKGENAAERALEDAISSRLSDKISIAGAKGILIHFNIHPQIALSEISSVMKVVDEKMDSNSSLTIFGTTYDSTLEKDEVKITIVATGFESKNDEVEEISEGNEENSNQNNNIVADSENYFDTPPLRRDYIVQYQLN